MNFSVCLHSFRFSDGGSNHTTTARQSCQPISCLTGVRICPPFGVKIRKSIFLSLLTFLLTSYPASFQMPRLSCTAITTCKCNRNIKSYEISKFQSRKWLNDLPFQIHHMQLILFYSVWEGSHGEIHYASEQRFVWMCSLLPFNKGCWHWQLHFENCISSHKEITHISLFVILKERVLCTLKGL